MPRFANHEVWVECAGQPLAEFDVRLSGNTVSCWIPSRTGGVIKVRWRDHSDPWEIHNKLSFFVDGVEVDSVTVRARPDIAPNYDMVGVWTNGWTIRPLVFSEIIWTANEPAVNGVRLSTSDIGSIVVEMRQVEVVALSEEYWAPKTAPRVRNEPLNEREVKAGVHRVGLSAETIYVNPGPRIATRPLDKKNPGPYIKFRFNYRPEDFLRAQGIIPPPPRIQYHTGSTGQKTIRAPEPSQDNPPKPRNCTRKRPAPERRVKSEEDVKPTILDSDSEDDSDSKELVRRLEYLQKHQAEIQKQQSALMSAKLVKVTRLRYWQKELEEAQRRLAEVVDEMKGAEKASRRKKIKRGRATEAGVMKIKREPGAGVVTVKREAGAGANNVIDLTLD